MWHNRDTDFARWLHPAMWHVALESWQVNSPSGSTLQCDNGSGMTCHEIHPNVRRIRILHLVSILTISPQSTCHSAPVCEILSKSDHLQQKKMTSCWFSRSQISAILYFRGPIMDSLKSPCTTWSSIETITLNCLVFWENRVFAIWRQTDRQTNMDTPVAWSRSRCRERRLNKEDNDKNLHCLLMVIPRVFVKLHVRPWNSTCAVRK